MGTYLLLLCTMSGAMAESAVKSSIQRCGFHCRVARRAERVPLGSGRLASMLELSNSLSSQSSSGRVGEGDEVLVDWVAPQDGDTAVRGTLSNEDLLSLGSHITKEAFGEALHRLVDGQTSRFIGSDGNKKSADFIQKTLGEEDGLETFQQSLDESSKTKPYLMGLDGKAKMSGGNVLALLKGSDPELANEVIVLASHYDSVNWRNTGGAAPGVDDNGSGTALVMLAAQTLARSQIKPKRSILFAAFNGEEEGLVGSANFVRHLKSGDSFLEGGSSFLKSGIAHIKKENIKGALIVDEVAWPGRGDSKNGAIFETRGPSADTSSLVNALAYTAKLKPDGDGITNFKVNWQGFGSDHISFLEKNIPAVLLIERDDEYHADTWGHSENDVFDHVDFEYGAAMTRLAIRTAMRLATPL